MSEWNYIKNMFKNIATKIRPYLSDGELFWFLSDKQLVYLSYFSIFYKFPDLANCKNINEKLQWFKLHGNLEKYSKYVDKFTVRDYIEQKIGNSHLVPLLGKWDKFENIPFETLPQKFVLKVTHGSGYVFICKDKSALNIPELRTMVNRWMSDNFYKKTRESQYKECTPKIICEKYLEDYSGGLIDYKFYCSNGEPKFLEVHSDRFIGHKIYYTDLNYKKLSISTSIAPVPDRIIKPRNFDSMVDIARKLASDFPFVRVDLYSSRGNIYFGELTFTPAAGLMELSQNEAYYLLGDMINLPKIDVSVKTRLIDFRFKKNKVNYS
jgi:hypothetical protein